MRLSPRCVDRSGKQFGWLTIVKPLRYDTRTKSVIWECKCRCGRTIELSSSVISAKRTHSCGKCGYQQQRMFELNAHKISGERFGKLIAIEPTSKRSGSSVIWRCICDCGNECYVSTDQLFKGETVSCGCYQLERVTKYHSEIEHLLADRWHRIQQRCYNPNDKNYARWGGRGIKMCDEWLHDKNKFIAWGISTGFKPWLTIDRIDNSKGYSPDNCRWVDLVAQANNRTNNRHIIVNDTRMTCGQWDKFFRLHPGYTWSYMNRNGKEKAEQMIRARLNGTWASGRMDNNR